MGYWERDKCVRDFFFSSRRRHTRYWRDWSSDGVLFRSDLGDVEGLYLGEIPVPKGGALEFDAKYRLRLAALVLVGGHEDGLDGPHCAEVYNCCALCDRVAPMQEVRVESLEKLEMLGGELRLSANSGGVSIVFPREIWKRILADAPAHEAPDPTELEELDAIKRKLRAHAEEQAFETILGGVRCGGSELEYDLVLRPAGLFAVTTGYYFVEVAGPDLMGRIGSSLEDDDLVEQAYVIGAVADPSALAAGDDK